MLSECGCAFVRVREYVHINRCVSASVCGYIRVCMYVCMNNYLIALASKPLARLKVLLSLTNNSGAMSDTSDLRSSLHTLHVNVISIKETKPNFTNTLGASGTRDEKVLQSVLIKV